MAGGRGGDAVEHTRHRNRERRSRVALVVDTGLEHHAWVERRMESEESELSTYLPHAASSLYIHLSSKPERKKQSDLARIDGSPDSDMRHDGRAGFVVNALACIDRIRRV